MAALATMPSLSFHDTSKYVRMQPVNKKHFALSEEHAAALKASGGVSEAHRDKRQRVER